MDRREALKTTSFVVGYSLSAAAIATALHGCKDESAAVTTGATEEWKPEFLDNDQVTLVAELSETLIPQTTSPGAKDVLVHQYIDDAMQHLYRPQEQYKFLQGLEDVQARARHAYQKTFQECTPEQRTELLKQLEQEAKKTDSDEVRGDSFFGTLKYLTYNGYFTSEKVGKEVLKFDPVPGEYLGCIPYTDVGKLWTI